MCPPNHSTMKTLRLFLSTAAVVAASLCAAEEPPLRITESFENGFDRWEPTSPANWKISPGNGGHVLDLFDKTPRTKPPHRSPFNFVLLKDHTFRAFTATAKVKTTTKAYGHRDVVFVFGWQDEAHFYYVHFGEKADPHSCQVFIVNGADRTKISTKETTGIPWKDDTWHTLKVTREVDGTILVYFDNMKETVLETKDTTFGAGRLGFGSFDDTAQFDDIEIITQR